MRRLSYTFVVRFGRPRRLSGDYTQLETHVPIPNTTVKQLGPMIVPKRAKVGHRRFTHSPDGFSRRGFFLRLRQLTMPLASPDGGA